MTFQQHLSDSSKIFTKKRYYIIVLSLFGCIGGLLSFGMYIGFIYFLTPIQGLYIGSAQVIKIAGSDQNFVNLNTEQVKVIFGIANEFLGTNLFPYIFMGFAIVTVIYIGQIFYSTNSPKLQCIDFYKILRIGLLCGLLGGIFASFVGEATVSNLLPLARFFGVDTSEIKESRVYITVIRLFIFSSALFFTLSFRFKIKRIWRAIAICVILNSAFFAWIKPNNEFVPKLYFSVFFATVVGAVFANHTKEDRNREIFDFSRRFKFLLFPSLAILGKSLLVLALCLLTFLYLFYNFNNFNEFQDCKQIHCALKVVGIEIN